MEGFGIFFKAIIWIMVVLITAAVPVRLALALFSKSSKDHLPYGTTNG